MSRLCVAAIVASCVGAFAVGYEAVVGTVRAGEWIWAHRRPRPYGEPEVL